MPETIDIPVIGKEPKKVVYLVGGVVAVALVVGYYRVRKASSEGSIPITTQIDPATGYEYGTSEDAASLAQQAGYVTAASGGGGDESNPTPQTSGFVNNAEWSQAAIDYLTNTVGADPGTVSSAIGKYLAGSALTDSEVSYVNQAIAVSGKPPVAGTNGYPPNVRQVATPPKPKVPAKPRAPRAYRVTDHSISIQWALGAGGTLEQVEIARNATFTSDVSTHHDAMSPGGWSGLDPDTTYYTRVRSHNSAGWGPWSDATAIRTHPKPKSKPKPKPAPRPRPKPKPKPRPKPKPKKRERTYRVKRGDNLFNIADKYYGNGNDWRKIYRANRSKIGGNPSIIHPGTVLVIP